MSLVARAARNHPHQRARGAGLLRADALRIPLADESVHLIVTSPPYFALRSYQDGDEHYAGQIGPGSTSDRLRAEWDAGIAELRELIERTTTAAAGPESAA